LIARALAAALLAVTATAAPVQAQTARRELDRLRAQLELPESVRLAPATEIALPAGGPLRVRLAFGLDLKARENVARWIAEWNRKDGARLGTLRIVEEGPADVVLARYTDREKVRTRTVTGPDLGPSGPGASRRSSTRTRFELDTVPVYAYVIDSRRPDLWSVVWRHTGFTTLDETGRSGRELWDGLRELLKERRAR
jgi:hypothetical protein